MKVSYCFKAVTLSSFVFVGGAQASTGVSQDSPSDQLPPTIIEDHGEVDYLDLLLKGFWQDVKSPIAELRAR
ncbi:hypothetical protein [Pseudobacteriovorax antillogorgiicola]|uniref:Uncharacterized protein n=1 Tax=Pseudobacteriovorax antillogorgiicola TaxID=1513793 RepID=A0A1Y6C737_9BACT|nr:hypothetical protein [Pseudobacteriovorax antillogorgiicola]TCS51178.1 hypothetical protein EDD56_11162 [Pseudobacteriovorax antillogorgiicola]SMF37956.1 hypothetical protein SAMN06296036_111116 [Pseudobacteriovorax antillogorgiicola]